MLISAAASMGYNSFLHFSPGESKYPTRWFGLLCWRKMLCLRAISCSFWNAYCGPHIVGMLVPSLRSENEVLGKLWMKTILLVNRKGRIQSSCALTWPLSSKMFLLMIWLRKLLFQCLRLIKHSKKATGTKGLSYPDNIEKKMAGAGKGEGEKQSEESLYLQNYITEK